MHLLTLLYSQWYIWSDTKKRFMKKVPLNIGKLLTLIGLAHIIMDNGFKSGKDMGLSIEYFSLQKIELLKCTLESKFGLKITVQIRHFSGSSLDHKLHISSKSWDILLSLVQSHFINSMNYMLDL